MTKAGEKLIVALQSGIAETHFFNPFSGKTELFVTERQATGRMFEAAAERINDLEEQIRQIKAHLVL